MESLPKGNNLPNLRTFLLTAYCVTSECIIKRLFMEYFPSLRSLFIDNIAKEDEGELLFVLGKGQMESATRFEYRTAIPKRQIRGNTIVLSGP